jgi:hypothetical protein
MVRMERSVGPFGFHKNLAFERMTVFAYFKIECYICSLSDMILNAQRKSRDHGDGDPMKALLEFIPSPECIALLF